VILSLTLAGCSGGSSKGSSTSKAPAAPATAATASSDDAALRSAPMHGLVVVTKQWLSTGAPNIKLWLVGYDPQTGSKTATRYFFPARGVTMAFTETQQAGYQRQSFGKDYTVVAATNGPDVRGVTSVGVVHTGDSQYTPLIKPGGPVLAGPFNPRTGRLWFSRAGKSFGSVDPAHGTASEKAEAGAVRTANGGVLWYGFAPDGFGPVWNTTVTGGNAWYFPNGQMMFGTDAVYVFGKQGAIGPGSKPVVALPAGIRGYPVEVVDNDRFVLVDTQATSLYLVTRSGTTLSAVKVVATTSGQIFGAVVSPQHDRLAFRLSNGGIFVVPLAGGATPRKVADVPVGLNDQKSMLIDWIP
jgi:hypothetical protein